MSRIRTIKPEFPQSETMGRLTRDARLLFIQLWTIVDDAGRTRAASRMLASLLYPYDDDARGLMDAWLAELEKQDCIRRYEVDGSSYLEIVNWLKHQKIDRPSASRLPAFTGEIAKPREPSRALDADLVPSTSTLDQVSRAVGKPTRSTIEISFEDFWKVYPRRGGANPKSPAFKVFKTFVASGVDPQAIIDGARRCAEKEAGKIGTEFIPQSVKWLRDRRWEDYNTDERPLPSSEIPGFYAAEGSPELDAWDAHYRATKHRNAPRDRNAGWRFPQRWPPGLDPPAADRQGVAA